MSRLAAPRDPRSRALDNDITEPDSAAYSPIPPLARMRIRGIRTIPLFGPRRRGYGEVPRGAFGVMSHTENALVFVHTDEGFVYAQAKASVLRRLDRLGRAVPVEWPVSS